MSGVSTCHLWRNALIVVGSSYVGVHSATGNGAMILPESCRSANAHGAISVYSRELRCRLDRRFMRLKAASAVKSHRRQPHFIPICALTVGGRLLLPFRGSDQLFISQNAYGRLHIGIVGPEKRRLRCLSGSNRRGTNEKMIPKGSSGRSFCLARGGDTSV